MRNEPYQFPGESKPSSAIVTYIYIHGQGATFNTLVGGQAYQFDIPMPPKPFLPGAQLRSSVIGLPFGGPAPITYCQVAVVRFRWQDDSLCSCRPSSLWYSCII